MQTYGDIINRISEIIALSEQRKNEINVVELNANYNNYFVSKLWFEIAVEYATEFEELLDSERTFYLLQNVKNFDELNKSNEDLKLICQERGSVANESTDDYLSLLEIINNASGKNASELTEYKGYFILKQDLINFIILCRKLKVGPYKSIKESTQEEVKNYVYREMEHKKNQKRRIDNYIIASVTEDFDDSLKDEVKTKKGGYTLFTTLEEKPRDAMFERKTAKTNYRELIYLGIIGELTNTMVLELKNVLTSDEFELLLDDLKKWQIFDEKEIQKIRQDAYLSEKNIEDIDQLVGFFVTRDNLDAEVLELLVPSIGSENYHYMMDKLFKYGAINTDSYLNYLEKTFGTNFQKK